MALTNQITEAKPKRSTIYEVAKLAGVSYSTVSRVFSRKDMVADETQKKVIGAANMLDFQPNMLARGLKGGRTQTMAVIWSQNQETLPMVRELTVPMQNRGYVLQLADHLDDPVVLKKILLEYLNRRIDAVVLEVRWNMQELEQVKDVAKQFPAAVFTTDIPPEDCRITDVDYVSQDHSVSIRQTVDHFVKTGRQRLAYMTRDERANQNKVGIFNDHAQKHGVERKIFDIASEYFSGVNIDQSLLREKFEVFFGKQGFKPDAILCDNTERAIAIMAWFREKGMRVPDDIAIVAREGTSICKLLDPPLACTQRLYQDVALTIEKMLSNRLSDPSIPQQVASIPTEFIWRESAG